MDGQHTHGYGSRSAPVGVILLIIAAVALISSSAVTSAISAAVTVVLIIVGICAGTAILGGTAYVVYRVRQARQARELPPWNRKELPSREQIQKELPQGYHILTTQQLHEIWTQLDRNREDD